MADPPQLRSVARRFGAREPYSAVDINASPQRVWEALTSFPTFPAWNPFIREAEGRLQPGARIKIKLRLAGRLVTFRPVLTVVDEPRELRWLARQWIPGLFDVDRRFRLEPLGASRCRFVQSESGSGIFAPLLMLLTKAPIVRGYEEFNAAIKTRVESTPAMTDSEPGTPG
jgi:hypothetical protein